MPVSNYKKGVTANGLADRQRVIVCGRRGGLCTVGVKAGEIFLMFCPDPAMTGHGSPVKQASRMDARCLRLRKQLQILFRTFRKSICRSRQRTNLPVVRI